MPRALVVAARGPRDGDGHDCRDEVRGARQEQRHVGAEAQRLDSRRHEVLEAVGRQVQHDHQGKQPRAVIGNGLPQPRHRARARPPARDVALDARVRELPLCGREPPCVERRVGQEEDPQHGDEDGDDALDQEEPAPALPAVRAVEAGEDACGDEAREGAGEHVARIEDRHARGYFFARVELADHV